MSKAPEIFPPLFFVNRVYWPEEMATAQLLTDLAERLAARGFPVTVVCRLPPGRRIPRKEVRAGVTILRVRSMGGSRRGWVGKAIHYGSFFPSALWRLALASTEGAVIVALTDPPLLGVGAWAVARWNRARLFHWIQDVYPEIALAVGAPRVLRVLQPLRNQSWKYAEFCACLGDDLAMTLQRARVPTEKIVLIPNWAPAGLLETVDTDAVGALRAQWELTGKFVVAYSGNLGRVHEFKTVLRAANLLRDVAEIVFIFVGDGPQRAAVENQARLLGLANIKFFPAQPRARLGATLAVGDVHLVTLRCGCEGFVFPSKLYGITAVGRPVIFIGPRESDIGRVVEDNGFGCAFDVSETAAVASALRGFTTNPVALKNLAAAAATFALKSPGPAAAAEGWEAMICHAADFYPLAPGKVRRVRSI